MMVAIPICGDRISPVLDVAKNFLLLDVSQGNELTRREIRIENMDLVAKAKRIVEIGSQVLICGAISWPLESMLVSAGVRVIPNTCGSLHEVVTAFVAGKLTEQAFLMPGCTGQRRRSRHRHRGGRKW